MARLVLVDLASFDRLLENRTAIGSLDKYSVRAKEI